MGKLNNWPIAVLGAVLGLGLVWALLWRPVSDRAEAVLFTIKPGQGAVAIGQDLKGARLIRSEQAFVAWIHWKGWAGRLKAGTYSLRGDMSVPEIAQIIVGGQALSDDNEITLPEGLNIWEIDARLAAPKLIKVGELRTKWSANEGKLFPETYRFAKDATAQDIATKMQATFSERAGQPRAPQIIIASILEKEAKSAEDMALVAGIMARRLELGMPLQIDATVGYGWCLRTAGYAKNCDVTQAPIATEIKVDGPYNTYTRQGLPAGPISNPGLIALNAAAHPKASPYLYYLSTRDGSQIIYAKTLDEHLANRRKYLGF